jgi:hypothetical protein
MKETSATKKPVTYGCEFCKREFLRESTTLRHVCEQKRRWLDKDNHGNRIAFQCWLEFYKKNTSKRKNLTQEEFINNPYYTAFVKFGNYCVSVHAINIPRFTDWLLKNQVKIDNWCSDSTYTKYLIEFLRHEDPFDAIHRSIEKCIEMAVDANIQPHDMLRYGNANKICYAITTGKISPWLLYQSDSGTQFLDGLNEGHVKMIIDYINPEQWAIKFKRDTDVTKRVKDTIKEAGY